MPVVEPGSQTVPANELVHADREIMGGLIVVIPVSAVAQRVEASHGDQWEFGDRRRDRACILRAKAQTGGVDALRTVVVEVRETIETVPNGNHRRGIDGENIVELSRVHAT